MERLIEDALVESKTAFLTDDQPDNKAQLDFYLPAQDVYIEVKRMHSPRIAEQTARAENVIVAQGEAAVKLLASLLRRTG